MNSHEVFIHIHQGCFAGTGAIVRLPQCQWSKLDGYGKISQCKTTTKHSKAKTVCIFLGIYCRYVLDSRGHPMVCLTMNTTKIRSYIPSSIQHSFLSHYNDVTMSVIASQITNLTIAHSTVYSGADQRKHQSSASLAFLWGVHRDRWIPRTKGQLRGKCFHLMTSSWVELYLVVMWPKIACVSEVDKMICNGGVQDQCRKVNATPVKTWVWYNTFFILIKSEG